MNLLFIRSVRSGGHSFIEVFSLPCKEGKHEVTPVASFVDGVPVSNGVTREFEVVRGKENPHLATQVLKGWWIISKEIRDYSTPRQARLVEEPATGYKGVYHPLY